MILSYIIFQTHKIAIRFRPQQFHIITTTLNNLSPQQYNKSIGKSQTYNNLKMQESAESQKFSFGEVADTQYVAYEIIDTEVTLPYNPFLFDFKLSIIKTKPNYEQVGTQFPLSRDKKTTFCRKKKNQKEWTDPTSLPIYLNAQIISQKHFTINQRYMLTDQSSKHGTYFWISRNNPLKIQPNDTYLIARQPLTINKVVHLPKPTIAFTYRSQPTLLTLTKKLFLIGSHPKCDIVLPGLYPFEVCINLTSFKIFTYLDQEEASPEHGLWQRVRSDKTQGIQLQNGHLIMVEPYIFKVTS